MAKEFFLKNSTTFDPFDLHTTKSGTSLARPFVCYFSPTSEFFSYFIGQILFGIIVSKSFLNIPQK